MIAEDPRVFIELMFYAYRDFTLDTDQQLSLYGLGRAHHRVLYFVGRYPGKPVSHLLPIMKLTKQALGRITSDLIKQEFVEEKIGSRDRRERRLWLTERGLGLERELTERQSRRFTRAFRETSAEDVEGFCKVLLGMLDPVERSKVGSRLKSALTKGPVQDAIDAPVDDTLESGLTGQG